MWTISFQRIYVLPDYIKPIGIMHTPPLWFKGVTYPALAPSYELLWAYRKRLMDTDELGHWYQKEVLDHLDPMGVYNELNDNGNYDVALCCYGDINSFCCRRLCAGWLSFATRNPIPEFPDNYSTVGCPQ